MGFAHGAALKAVSFADVLDESAETGYQRRFIKNHSLDFRRYIQTDGGTTIPLTFNLRPGEDIGWQLKRLKGERADLLIDISEPRVMAQVDCQHRMGFMTDLQVPLPFMAFIGLELREEMEVFSVINSKAKGLNASLLDFHASVLTADLALDRPELLISLFLHREPTSPWLNQLDLGGDATSGMARKASLRTMQKAVKKFLARSNILQTASPAEVCQIVENYWLSIVGLLESEWSSPRKHVLTKGIGVYALMGLAADMAKEANCDPAVLSQEYFTTKLSDFVHDIDWSSSGPFKGLGGEKGAAQALDMIRDARRAVSIKLVQG